MLDELKVNDKNIKKVLSEDLIGRNKYINNMMKMLNSIKNNKIIGIDGEWGCGKTFFVKSLEYLIENDDSMIETFTIDRESLKKLKSEYMVIYYNAWENDDVKSSLLSLMNKIVNDSLKNNKDTNKIVEAIPKVLNAGIKYLTKGVVDIKQDFGGENWNKNKIMEEIVTIEEVKSKFTNAINELLIENKNKILIIIDEIDRCKPTFAIDLLENIKHFYDDDRIVFLVATNNKELSNCVCKVYGENYDGNGYLDKFFDFVVELNQYDIDNYINRYFPNNRQYINIFSSLIIKENKLTMREINRFYSCVNYFKEYIEINTCSMYKDSCKCIELYIVLLYALGLKIKDKKEYYNFIKGKGFLRLKDFILNREECSKCVYVWLKEDEEDMNIKNYSTKIREDGKIEKVKEMYLFLTTGNRYECSNLSYQIKGKELLEILSFLSF